MPQTAETMVEEAKLWKAIIFKRQNLDFISTVTPIKYIQFFNLLFFLSKHNCYALINKYCILSSKYVQYGIIPKCR